uniref:Uncharacterized protein n=1 Tax=Zea mays TaxID=4577 RepID=B6TQA8_MAIZE|nr:hypothetical protein [Zea mays]
MLCLCACALSQQNTREQLGPGFVKYPKMCNVFALMVTRLTC